MPYKNPERKRQWEKEHREQRNVQRRKQRLSGIIVAKRTPEPISAQGQKSIWPVVAQILAFAVVIGIGLLAGWVEISPLSPGRVGQPK